MVRIFYKSVYNIYQSYITNNKKHRNETDINCYYIIIIYIYIYVHGFSGAFAVYLTRRRASVGASRNPLLGAGERVFCGLPADPAARAPAEN